MSHHRNPERKNDNLVSESDFRAERESAKKALKRELGLQKILGRSKGVQELREKIDRISSCDVNVLISGESGTGKELAARAIHYLSSRADKPFVPVNCGAIPENLFENELFGHVKGAFTDAKFPQSGLVKEAEGGTLFLDEIGAVSPYIQIKFLRLLQDNEYRPLGGSTYHKANIRIIAATNQDLPSLVNRGAFREDLFYRLDIISIHIPPLRERIEDIPILVEHFMNQYSKEFCMESKEVSHDTMKTFIGYSWPGNIRELENQIQQLLVMCPSELICAEDVQFSSLPEEQEENQEFEHFQTAKKRVVDDFEKTYLTQLLTEHKGNMVIAANAAGKSRTALWNLLKRHNLSPKEFRI
ncbi:MAG: sigma-54-dependent Fis family transcriptional regulator [Gemmatimonadota bacterium]|nr:MAG: sigma-54-dependent Fis family transcriptional regulator [Gemmatimonadota bacterium]